MPTPDLIFDAEMFVAAGLALALITLWLRRDLRGNMINMSITMGVGLVGLLVLARYGGALTDATIAVVVREALLLLVAIGFTRVALMCLFQGVLARLAIPRILADVLIAVVLVVFALVRMKVIGVNLAGIITTSAVITGVIAFSLQETLGNLWGGIALQLDNTCRIGDWIRMEGVSGQVVGIRWRYTAIATNSGETVIIPNGQLIKNRVTVLGRRGDERIPSRRSVEFNVSYDVPPSRVLATVADGLARAEIRNVAPRPRLVVICTGFGDNGVQYAVRYWLTDLAHDLWTDSQVRLHVAATLARHNMEIPYPHRVVVARKRPGAAELRERERDARCAVLAQIDLFAALTDGERRALASELADCPYVADDVIARQGEAADSLYILAHGRVEVYDDSTGGTGTRDHLATLEAPSYFGEMGLLTGQPRRATVIAQNEVLCYRLDKSGFDAVVRARAELLEPVSQVVVARQSANDARLQALSDEVRGRQDSYSAAELVRRIRKFFSID
ncbi:MAG TPA: mechanosensitive ion channel family protein [Casimicrobiaceae bacterium]|nr:mechanosensitive ion channel family protein [Casimicrobiaceae bacterium]